MTNKKLSYRLGNFLGIVFLLLSIISIYRILGFEEDKSAILDYIFMLVVGLSILITSRFLIGRFVQVLGLCFTAIVTVLTDPNIDYFLLQLVIVYLLAVKYGFWKQYIFVKTVISLILIVGLIALSYVFIERSLNDTLKALIFYIIFLFTFSLITLDDMKSYFESIKKLKGEISELSSELVEKDKLIESLEPDFIDPVASGLTKAELKLLETLCVYRESNQELSERLGKSGNTIKTQLKSIMQKIGVDNRHQLIEACKDYFYALKI